MAQPPVEFYASASPGTEPAVHDELRELGLRGVRWGRGGIPFLGAWEDGWRACLHSRTAQRIYTVLARFEAADADALYAGAGRVDWTPYLTPEHTLAVAAFTASEVFTHASATALTVKDAIVDQLRARCGGRPSVARDDPDVRAFVYAAGTRVTLYLDLSGEPLHRRGYRTEAGAAPLRETLAAAILRLAGWDRRTPLIDPMCGSGTIAIEAALWAGDVAPGILRERFGFERWANFGDAGRAAMRAMRGAARRTAHAAQARVAASDADEGVLELARDNARRAGVRVAFRCRSVTEWQSDGVRRVAVTNPPYDERMGADAAFFREVGAAFCRMHGSRLAVLSGNPACGRAISLPPVLTRQLKNGDLDCELLVYEVPPRA